jgi:4-amino-4-deoxy-L-arabinose transferase-like glycosyltransferase
MLTSRVIAATSRGKLILFVAIPLLSMFMHWHVFSTDLVGIHVWRQTQTQTVIDNFANEDFNILHPRINSRGSGDGIFRMEFPVMQWLYACFYKLFGNHIIITRILSFVTGLFSIWGMYRLVAAVFRNERMALIGAWCFTFSPVFYYYTLNPLPDNFALCMGIWGMALFFEWATLMKGSLLLLSAVFLALATLAKLPFVVYLGAIAVYLVSNRKSIQAKTALLALAGFTVCFLAPALWYATTVGGWEGNGIVHGILSATKSDVPVLLDIMQANLTSTLPELLINYGSFAFFLAGFWFLIRNKAYRSPLFKVFLGWGICVLLYFLFEMNMIAKTHDYYLFPFLPLLFILVSYGAWNLFNMQVKALKVFVVVALCVVPLTAFLRIHNRWNTAEPGFNEDIYNHRTELRNAVPDNALCVIGNDESTYIYYYYLHKKGWSFANDYLPGDTLKAMISKGARYMYSDSRRLESDSMIHIHLDKLIMKQGTINVYSLK